MSDTSPRGEVVQALLDRNFCGMSEDAEAAADLVLAAVVRALENGYHAQNPSLMHPADYVTLKFECDGYEGLADIRRSDRPWPERDPSALGPSNWAS